MPTQTSTITGVVQAIFSSVLGLFTALPAYVAHRARRFKLGAAFNMIAAASQMGCGAQYQPLATTAERFCGASNANDAAERLDSRRDG
jgi:hypothetical protein